MHHALGDAHRLAVIDALALCDRTPSELQAITGLTSNLLAFHLDVLEDAGVLARRVSFADRRRRYVTLRDGLADAGVEPRRQFSRWDGPVLFVCRRNSARSQLAAALWAARTRRPAVSAGAEPAARIHPLAVEVARRHGLNLSAEHPHGYDEVDADPGLIVSVCDRAREAGLPFEAPTLHWSVPDPADGGLDEFERTYRAVDGWVERLAEAAAA